MGANAAAVLTIPFTAGYPMTGRPPAVTRFPFVSCENAPLRVRAFTPLQLEQSNVNISAEFSNLIIAQRAFEANAKSVTTFDTVAQDTINMIH